MTAASTPLLAAGGVAGPAGDEAAALSPSRDRAAELRVLAAAMKSEELRAGVIAGADAADFADPGVAEAFATARELHREGVAPTPETVLDALGADRPGARAAVEDALAHGGAARSRDRVEGAVRRVRTLAFRRSLSGVAAALARAAERDGDVAGAADAAVSRITAARIAVEREADLPADPGSSRAAVWRELGDRMDGRGPSSVKSGLRALDDITGGWAPGNLVCLAGRPAMGKSAAALWIARHVSVEVGPVAYFSQEMSVTELRERLAALETGVDSRRIRAATQLSEGERDRVLAALEGGRDRIYFSDRHVDIDQLEARARKTARVIADGGGPPLAMIVVDYLQMMRDSRTSPRTSREQEVGSRSRRLKQLARDLDVPILMLSQLSRAVEHRGGDRRPILADLRDSGSIEQDSDSVVFVYRPDYYGITEDGEGASTAGLMTLVVAKNRHGGCGDANLRYFPATNALRPWSSHDARAAGPTGGSWAPRSAATDGGGGGSDEAEAGVPF